MNKTLKFLFQFLSNVSFNFNARNKIEIVVKGLRVGQQDEWVAFKFNK